MILVCERCKELRRDRDLLEADLKNAEKDLRAQRRSVQALKREFARVMAEHPSSPDVKLVLEHWQQVIAPRAKIPPDGIRARKVLEQLRHYSVDELCHAVDACAESDFHMGRSKKTAGRSHNDIELICRDEAHVERFLAMYAPKASCVIQTQLKALKDLRALRDGEWEARCPGHEDKNRSLYVCEIKGSLSFHCSKGCRVKTIKENLK